MAMNHRVLTGFADALAAIESVWCLVDEGFDVHVFARRGSRPALARSNAVNVISITAPEEDAERSAADLAAAVRTISPAAILPLDDHAVWLCDRISPPRSPRPEQKQKDQAVVAGPVGSMASLALDKRQQLLLAEAVGFDVPASANAASEPPPGNGPWMVKPALAVELRDRRLARPVGRLARTSSEVRDVAAAIGGPAIAQPLITGAGEGVFGFAAADGVTALSAHRRIRMMNPRGSGSSACRSIPVADELVAPVLDFVAKSGWYGLFMIELLRDDRGRAWFMELNGRAWGSMALARSRGFAYPAWAVRAALDDGYVPTGPTDPPHATARHLGREIVHLGAVMARGGAPRLRTARDVLTLRRDEHWYNWRRGQAAVFAADTWATLRGQLHRRRSA
jgi:hypothetical protein